MSALDSVISALGAAVTANPKDPALRLHLASVLVEAGQPAVALEHYAAVLALDPVNLAALKGAATAAEQSNDTARAAAYRKLHASLAGEAQPAPVMTIPSIAPSAPSAPPAQPPKLRVIQGGVASSNEAEPEQEELEEDLVPNVTLADVGGLAEVKRRLDMAFLAPMRNPEVRKLYAKKLRGGLLMYGPPGCGKTYIARALAGELRAKFMSIELSDVLDMYLGESERKLHELFENARRNAPVVLFFDEIDALGQKRSQQRQSAGRNVVNQLLSEMDGVGHSNEGVFILGATNHPWDVDAALRRSGRFDRVLLVLPPDQAAREAILSKHLSDKPVADVDVAALAKQTAHFSGADLAHLCESATELAMEDALKSGTARPIAMTDFKKALKDVRPTTRQWFDLAKNYAMFANEGGVYDDLLAYVKDHKL
jgi:SpoVK/Ycf46/Vps4 family AAA+-type ATPase